MNLRISILSFFFVEILRFHGRVRRWSLGGLYAPDGPNKFSRVFLDTIGSILERKMKNQIFDFFLIFVEF